MQRSQSYIQGMILQINDIEGDLDQFRFITSSSFFFLLFLVLQQCDPSLQQGKEYCLAFWHLWLERSNGTFDIIERTFDSFLQSISFVAHLSYISTTIV